MLGGEGAAEGAAGMTNERPSFIRRKVSHIHSANVHCTFLEFLQVDLVPWDIAENKH